MLKKSITFRDLDGKLITEDFYFNVTKAEIAELEVSRPGGFSSFLEAIIAAEDAKEVLVIFKEVIGMTVGKRSEDGRRFIKSDEIRDDFLQTDAYSELFMEYIQNPAEMAKFVRSVLPVDVAEDLEKNPKFKDLELPDVKPWIAEDRQPTKAELAGMSQEELVEAFEKRERLKMGLKTDPQ